MSYTIANNTLTFNSDKSVEFDSTIGNVIETHGNVIVLVEDVLEKKIALSEMTFPHASHNILCFNLNGQLLWKIENKYSYSGEDQNPYLSLNQDENGILWAHSWAGMTVIINPIDGTIKPRNLGSRPW